LALLQMHVSPTTSQKDAITRVSNANKNTSTLSKYLDVIRISNANENAQCLQGEVSEGGVAARYVGAQGTWDCVRTGLGGGQHDGQNDTEDTRPVHHCQGVAVVGASR
jgi:hypothetical protein